MVDSPADMLERLTALDTRVETLARSCDERFDAIDQRFRDLDASLDRRFADVTVTFVELRDYIELAHSDLLRRMNEGFARVDGQFANVDSRLDRLERKLDQFIDVQLQTNMLVDRRLRALERRRPRPA